VDPTANQDSDQSVTDRETFQLEFDVEHESWRVRTTDNQYWSVEAASGIQASASAPPWSVHLFLETVIYRVGHKKPTIQIILFLLHVYMFICINNTALQSPFLSTQD